MRFFLSIRRRFSTIFSRYSLKKCGTGTVFDVNVSLYQPKQISIGEYCIINAGSVIQSCESAEILIGNHVTLSYRCIILTGGLEIATIGNNRVHTANNVTIQDNVWVGAGAIILPGVTLYEGAVVAAGSVVTRDVAKKTLVGGNPAKVIRTLNN